MKRLALMVGHNKAAPGADAKAPINMSEYAFHTKVIVPLALEYAKKIGLECKVFLRDAGRDVATKAVNAWLKGHEGVCIELHFNSATPAATGTEVLIDTDPKENVQYGQMVVDAIVTTLGLPRRQKPSGLKYLKAGDRGHYNVRMLTCTSCLVEPFFGSNSKDCARMWERRAEYAKCLVDASAAYLKLKPVAPTKPAEPKTSGIKEIQAMLNTHGYAVRVDGVFGFETTAAVKAFQKSKGLEVDGVVGPMTIAALRAAPIVVSTSGETPWMDWVEKHMGQKEIPGKKHNPFIVELFSYTSYDADADEVPWCAALINAALVKTGFKGTRSAAAASFDKYGTKCELKYGCIVTLRHKTGGRHVAFYAGKNSKGQDIFRGGNQSNALKDSVYPTSTIVASRWPVKA